MSVDGIEHTDVLTTIIGDGAVMMLELEPLVLPSYTVTIPTGAGYTVVPEEGSETTVEEGGSFSFTVEIAEGYAKNNDFEVRVNGVDLEDDDGVYTIENITADQLIEVDGIVKSDPTPDPNPKYNITLTDAKAYDIAGNEITSAKAGDKVVLKANDIEGKIFDVWTVVGAEIDRYDCYDNPLTFVMPAANVSAKANYNTLVTSIKIKAPNSLIPTVGADVFYGDLETGLELISINDGAITEKIFDDYSANWWLFAPEYYEDTYYEYSYGYDKFIGGYSYQVEFGI